MRTSDLSPGTLDSFAEAVPPSPTTSVCFVVTKADVPPPPSTMTGQETWDLKAARGDFGCFVDPSVTQLVQAGVKRGVGVGGSFSKWIGIGKPVDVRSSLCFAHLSDPFFAPCPGGLLPASNPLPAAVELQSIVSSSLVASMASYDLDLSVLVKGSRGSGKRTVVRSVAAASGLGVMEVSPAS